MIFLVARVAASRFGERRLLARIRRQLAGETDFRQAVENNRQAACAPLPTNPRSGGFPAADFN
jgi:hypothetical protein